MKSLAEQITEARIELLEHGEVIANARDFDESPAVIRRLERTRRTLERELRELEAQQEPVK